MVKRPEVSDRLYDQIVDEFGEGETSSFEDALENLLNEHDVMAFMGGEPGEGVEMDE